MSGDASFSEKCTRQFSLAGIGMSMRQLDQQWVLLRGNRGRASGSRHDFKAVQADGGGQFNLFCLHPPSVLFSK